MYVFEKMNNVKNELEKEMEEVKNIKDIEERHRRADEILCELLENLGFENLVETYREVYKWYA